MNAHLIPRRAYGYTIRYADGRYDFLERDAALSTLRSSTKATRSPVLRSRGDRRVVRFASGAELTISRDLWADVEVAS